MRKAMYLTQEELAPLLGMSIANVRRIEAKDRASVYPRTMRNFAKLMGVSIEEAQTRLRPEDSPTPDFAALAHAHNLTVEQLHAAVQTALETGRWPEITRATAGERAETIEKTADSLTSLGVVERGKRRTKG